MSFTRRIIIGGPPRTGSTLLRFLLDASPAIISGPETSFFLQPLSHHQGKLDATGARLARVLELAREPIADCLQRARDSMEAFDGIMELYCRAARVRKDAWAEKTPRNCFCYHRLESERPDALFVSIVRHGLDIVTSRIDDHPVKGDGYWCSIQRYVDSMRAVYAFNSPRHHIVRYEDLVARPAETVRGLFAFLDLPFDEGILGTFNQETFSRDLSKVHQPRLRLPIQTTWVDRWRQPEHAEVVAAFRARDDAMEWLARSGYSAH
jgi:hypothetical protein